MKIGASGIILKEKTVLFILRSKNASSYANCWTMPGGRGEIGETPEENVIREVREEVHLEFTPEKIFKTYQWRERTLFRFLGSWSGEIKLQEEEVTQWKFYSYTETKELTVAFDYDEVVDMLFEQKLIE